METNNLETKADRNAQDANAKIASGQEVTELMHDLGRQMPSCKKALTLKRPVAVTATTPNPRRLARLLCIIPLSVSACSAQPPGYRPSL
jgi:hypothetical protein